MSAVLIPVSETVSDNPYYMLESSDQAEIEHRVRTAVTEASASIVAKIAGSEGISPKSKEFAFLSAEILRQVNAYVCINAASGAKR